MIHRITTKIIISHTELKELQILYFPAKLKNVHDLGLSVRLSVRPRSDFHEYARITPSFMYII